MAARTQASPATARNSVPRFGLGTVQAYPQIGHLSSCPDKEAGLSRSVPHFAHSYLIIVRPRFCTDCARRMLDSFRKASSLPSRASCLKFRTNRRVLCPYASCAEGHGDVGHGHSDRAPHDPSGIRTLCRPIRTGSAIPNSHVRKLDKRQTGTGYVSHHTRQGPACSRESHQLPETNTAVKGKAALLSLSSLARST